MSKRALVLSGGGFFGAYEVGAWSAIESHFKPDLIVGASIGSLNAWSIAGGASAAELTRNWLNLKMSSITHASQPIEEIYQAYSPRMDVCVVLTDILRVRTRSFVNEQITGRHLAASCAVPFILPFQRIDGVWYADGGLLNALPLAAAIALGATEIIGVNVWAPLPWWAVTPGRVARVLTRSNPKIPKGVKIHLLTPRKFLGTFRQAANYDRATVERWIAEGHADATKHFPPGMF